MKRRTFLLHSSVLAAGAVAGAAMPAFAGEIDKAGRAEPVPDLYTLFKDPPMACRPFVRWWWNGDKVEKAELSRELKLLKEAGIGGVEINPIKFPARTDDLGRPSLRWLSDEWIDALQHTFTEAKALGLTCDLIVGSGWPFGAEYLEGEEQAQVMITGVKKLEGSLDFELPLFDLLKEADPAVSSPYARRRMEVLSVQLVPDPFNKMDEIIDLSHQIKTGYIRAAIPKGKYALYFLVKISGFLEVINGVPGADGPVLNHYNKAAVTRYLNHMTDGIQQKTGPLSKHIRAFFTDSMELEGANWTADLPQEFEKRRGYNLMPYLPFIQFKTASMGNVADYGYGAQLGPEIKNAVQRVRYDFELTKTELLQERFIAPFTQWCSDNGVQSRAQAYGRGFFPLEGSFDIDIPESETWIKAGIGMEMPETDPRIGRGYTMINKFVASAAHLKGKKLISCEELTNTDVVFNEALELLKVTADLSVISGVTHPVFHGFNYSPPEAPFPGWIRYGCYLNERNTMWPYFKYFTDYRSRLSAVLQQAEMFADIALLPPTADMWSVYGAQNEPFPSFYYPAYLSLIWEAIHQNGNGCDYISESVICNSKVKDGYLHYGKRKYHTIFLIQIDSLEPATTEKLFAFVQNGGRIFCLNSVPRQSLGWKGWQQKDKEVKATIERMKAFTDRFILLNTPEKDFIQWYAGVQKQHSIIPYVNISKPDRFVTQVRYQTTDTEMLYFINSGMDDSHPVTVTPDNTIIRGRQAWVWDAVTGDRWPLEGTDRFELDLGPAQSVLLVFDKTKKGKAVSRKTLPVADAGLTIDNWTLILKHINGSENQMDLTVLKDLKDSTQTVFFSGTAIYKSVFNVTGKTKDRYLDLGKVHGISQLIINGKDCGLQWYGRRIFPIADHIQPGSNTIEIKIITTMGNYMKTLKDNPIAQYWTAEKRKDQPIQSMGLVGPVTLM